VSHLPRKISQLKTEELLNRVTIRGLRKVSIRNLDSLITAVQHLSEGAEVQLFDADRIASRRHLEFAALNALKAFQGGYNVSKSIAIEALRFASAQMQIGKAFKIVGLNPQTRNLAVLIISGDERDTEKTVTAIQRLVGGTPDDGVLEIGSEKKLRSLIDLFKISPQALKAQAGGSDIREAVVNLIVEGMALLATGR